MGVGSGSGVRLSSNRMVESYMLIIICVNGPVVKADILCIRRIRGVRSRPGILRVTRRSTVRSYVHSPNGLMKRARIRTFMNQDARVTILMTYA